MNRTPLDYAPPDPSPGFWSRPWVAGLLAFPVCWSIVLLLYWGSTFADGFDDERFHWAEARIAMSLFGSAVGVPAYVASVDRLAAMKRRRGAKAG